MVLIRQMMLYSGRMVVVVEGDCVRANKVVFGQKLLYSGKVVVFGQK